MINETVNPENGVNGTRPNGQGASPGTVSGELQPEPGRNPTTARRGWGNRLNKIGISKDPPKSPGSLR